MTALINNQIIRRASIDPPTNGIATDFFEQNYVSKLRAKTDGQQEFLDTMDRSLITLCHGPAGTGKTYLAVGKALEWLHDNNKNIHKIIACRPIIECGPRIGYLPGDSDEKIKPYMRPIVDKLHKFLDTKTVERYITIGKIEIESITYMRGMSYDNSLLILDEAQNAEYNEILMFLTRLGENSRAIICGDTDQTDLREMVAHAYDEFIHRANKPPYIDGLETCELTEEDIVRSKIVQQIVKKFGKR